MKWLFFFCLDVIEVWEFKVKNIKKMCYFLLNVLNEIWVSDGIGCNFVEIDL